MDFLTLAQKRFLQEIINRIQLNPIFHLLQNC